MALTNYPYGVSSFGVPVMGSGSIPTTTGTYYFVSSATTGDSIGSSGNDGKSPQSPLATVQQAIDKCVADKGDVVILLPGHAETLTATSVAMNKAGVTVISLGQGSKRATFTCNATASTVTVSADNCAWVNTRVIGNLDNVVTAFTTTTAKYFRLEGNEFLDVASNLHFLSILTTATTDNAADGLQIIGNSWWGLAIAPAAAFSILGDLDHLVIAGNRINMASTDDEGSFLTLTADTIRNAVITRNTHIVTGSTGAAVGIFLTGSATDCTGEVSYNLVASLDTTAELIATAGTGLKFFENYYTGTADTSGKIWPAADAA